MESWEDQISAVAALDDPTRRRLYDYVVHHPTPVSRDDAAAALELPRTTAAFHLDRLVDEGLLDVVYQRRTGRTGRTGPGAGRPAKLYRRSDQHVAVSLPQRRYDLAGRLLSSAIEHAERSGDSPRAILDQRAYQLGRELGDTTRNADGDGDTRETAHLDPAPPRCCVRLEPTAPGNRVDREEFEISSNQTFVIVGASLAGAKAAETLGQAGFDGRVAAWRRA
jgi:DNA-binding transcriptional ArsR family regulator